MYKILKFDENWNLIIEALAMRANTTTLVDYCPVGFEGCGDWVV